MAILNSIKPRTTIPKSFFIYFLKPLRSHPMKFPNNIRPTQRIIPSMTPLAVSESTAITKPTNIERKEEKII